MCYMFCCSEIRCQDPANRLRCRSWCVSTNVMAHLHSRIEGLLALFMIMLQSIGALLPIGTPLWTAVPMFISARIASHLKVKGWNKLQVQEASIHAGINYQNLVGDHSTDSPGQTRATYLWFIRSPPPSLSLSSSLSLSLSLSGCLSCFPPVGSLSSEFRDKCLVRFIQ